ncbi:hypothetical protein [Bradymonas sediminis]|uniref:Uncharacterized protein n=1 Tax=Bradymonas sediminis TaxID=1548548 RepID=A0A2Z4FQG1_9DELT|nr:hypothetical protein [Bradymonas sediminis]AWV91160.1 hypothetical protein DN745_18245 [Bradymonas sediminis]TDP73722.1 hypothetical protein DFR33_10554 [Bradymonas sediminis]
MTKKLNIALIVALASTLGMAAGCEDPGDSDQTPLYRWVQDGAPSSGERGAMMITEINYAGSVRDDGTHDADDIFIELQNKHPRPINISGWHLTIKGDLNREYRIPMMEDPIMPNDYFVIARKADGAFKDSAGVIMPELELGVRRVRVQLRDYDKRMMEDGGSTLQEVFTGGYDTVSTRSMERVQLIFANAGGNARNWHAYSNDRGGEGVAEGWKKFTLMSPGEANSSDYSGSSTTGSFE